jgi:hypothetical protein
MPSLFLQSILFICQNLVKHFNFLGFFRYRQSYKTFFFVTGTDTKKAGVFLDILEAIVIFTSTALSYLQLHPSFALQQFDYPSLNLQRFNGC